MQYQQQTVRLPSWVLPLAISVLAQLGGVVWLTATMSAKIEALTDRVARLERQIDSVTNVTRSPKGYTSPAIVP